MSKSQIFASLQERLNSCLFIRKNRNTIVKQQPNCTPVELPIACRKHLNTWAGREGEREKERESLEAAVVGQVERIYDRKKRGGGGE
jgi:hypothetical protein